MEVEFALRFVTQSLASLTQVKGSGHLISFGSEAFDFGAEDFFRQLADFLMLPPAFDFDQLCATLLAAAPSRDAKVGDLVTAQIPHAMWPGQYPPPGAEKAELWARLIKDYQPLASDEPMLRVVWPAEVFADWDRPGSFVSGPISLVGRLRFLVCGPYLHLPKGDWKARVKFDVSENFSGNKLYSDILANGEVIAGVVAPLPKNGRFAYELEFKVVDPYLPLEVRIEIREGAIEGAINLIEVDMTRV
jgi:hypothetical protein